MQRFFSTIALASVLVLLLVAPVAAAPPVTETLTVDQFMGSGYVPDGATAVLKRHSNKVHVKITTNNLEPGDVYTVWAVIWNDPTQCTVAYACGPDDVGPDTAGNSIIWATGKVINSQGAAVFNALIHEGSPPGAVNFGDGLTSAENAEIHFIIRSHGQPIPGLVNVQRSTLNGGCEPGDPNMCDDHQAVFP